MRISDDKIMSCELLTETVVMHNRFALIVQFTDRICETWLDNYGNRNQDFKEISKAKEMNRITMVRGNNDRIFFIETIGDSEKVIQIEIDSDQKFVTHKKVVFDIYGPKTISLATDCLNFEDDRLKKCMQSFFILNANARMVRVSNENDVYQVEDDYTLQHHDNIIDNLSKIKKTDWLSFHADDRSLTFGGTTYAYRSQVQFDIVIPKINQ